MAFPVVVTSNSTSHGVGSGARNVNMPASLVNGNTIYALGNFSEDITITPPSGFTEFAAHIWFAGVNRRARAFRKVSDGSEGATQSFTYSGTATGSWVTWQVSGVHNSDPEIEFATLGAGAPVDPPPITASWGAADNMFFAIYLTADSTSSAQFSAFPTGYSWTGEVGWNGTSGKMAVGQKTSTSATDNPDAFTLSSGTGQPSIGATMVIRPTAGGGGGGTKQLVFNVRDSNGTLMSSQTGLKVCVFDQGIGPGLVAPILTTAVAQTSGAGACTLSVEGMTAQAAGGFCSVVMKKDGTPNIYGVLEGVEITLST
jgi:hypothetical protein